MTIFSLWERPSLTKLPPQFDPYFQSILHTHRQQQVTWEMILPDILAIDACMSDRTGGSASTGGALAASHKGKGKVKGKKKNAGGGGSQSAEKPNVTDIHDSPQGKENNRDVECHHCHKKGHEQSTCFKKK